MPRTRRFTTRFPSFSRRDLFRLIAAILFSVAAGWLTIAVSAANTFRDVRPDLALDMQPLDSRARAALAERLAARIGSDPAARRQVERLAHAALKRDPTVVPAWRMLAFNAGLKGHPEQSRLLFLLAQRLSRRDLPTQLWLIEDRVAQNDIAGALRHYDIALRTSRTSADLLLPVLVSATAEPAVIGPLAEHLRRDPVWRRPFLARLAEQAPAPDNAVRLVERVAIGRGAPPDADVLIPLVNRFAEGGHLDAALRLYRLLGGREGTIATPIRNGGFERPNSLPPFEWELAEGFDYNATQETIPNAGQGAVLNIRARSGQGGPVARQLLVLAPGSYRIHILAGPVEGTARARLYWSVICAGEGRAQLLSTELRPAPSAATFRVPGTSCDGQWLEIGIRADFGPEGVGAWLDSVRVEQVR